MGYHMQQHDAIFNIPAKNIDFAKAAVLRLPRGAWVGYTNASMTFAEIMEAWRWEIKDDLGIRFNGVNAGNDIELFQALAPYVDDGCYIEMVGEDSKRWRWVFSKGKCLEVYPEILWPPLP